MMQTNFLLLSIRSSPGEGKVAFSLLHAVVKCDALNADIAYADGSML